MIESITEPAQSLDFAAKVAIFNQVTQELYDFIGLNHPCLNVQLVPISEVHGNDYNPNKVAPPEIRLLDLSIAKDGLTMPVVACKSLNGFEVVDGFHRRTRCDVNPTIRKSLNGYLPISILNKPLEERVTSTVRHNMARGTHQVGLSAKLVVFLKKHNWSNEKIGRELGMDADEVLRMRQVTGLAEAFSDREFSNSWDIEIQLENGNNT